MSKLTLLGQEPTMRKLTLFITGRAHLGHKHENYQCLPVNPCLSIHIPYEQTHCIWAGTNNAKINSITGRAHLGHKRGHYQCLSVIYPLLTVLSYMPVVLNYISS